MNLSYECRRGNCISCAAKIQDGERQDVLRGGLCPPAQLCCRCRLNCLTIAILSPSFFVGCIQFVRFVLYLFPRLLFSCFMLIVASMTP